MGEFDDILKEFLVESYENLDQLDQDLVALESDPENRDRLASIFRTIHTIKGSAGFFGFDRLQAVTHAGENLLVKLRDGELRLTPEINDVLLAMVDAVRDMLAAIEATGSDGDKDYSELVRRIEEIQAAAGSDAEQTAAESSATDSAETDTERSEPVEQPATDHGSPGTAAEESAMGQQEPATKRGPAEAPTQSAAASASANRSGGGGHVKESTIRVDVNLLDKLMNLVGELVLARNQILQFSATQTDAAFLNASQRLSLVTTELQESVMKTRMQPIGTIWSKLPRVVRDLARQCGRQVKLEMEGKDVELDKSVIESIKDPLTHMIRNAVDHGIEPPEERVAKGKPPEGNLTLRAFHEGGQVIIEISDDGRGIDVEKVKEKAVRKGLITPEEAEQMTPRQAMKLIFLPGFSTAEKVTNVSGRGVGMDVVRNNIEKIGGSVDIQSHPGQGTTFRIKLPLTLAIIPALIVKSGGERMAIPQVSLLELVRLEGNEAKEGIEWVHEAPVYRLRGQLLPLVYLNEELGLTTNEEAESLNIVVLHAENRRFGLVVDEIVDTQEIVVKPLGKRLKGLSMFAGATIMGDGRVALILDVFGIAKRVGLVGDQDRALAELEEKVQHSEENTVMMLTVAAGEGRCAAIPLEFVARLEEIPADSIEQANGYEVVQYRGHLLPLVRLASLLNAMPSGDDPAKLHAVVCRVENKSVGLVVDRILDIVEWRPHMERVGTHPFVAGSTIISGRVTDLIDVERLLDSVEAVADTTVAA